MAWLHMRSPATLPIAGTLSLDHLPEHLEALQIEPATKSSARCGDSSRFGGPYRTRTCDPLRVMQVRYQLRQRPR